MFNGASAPSAAATEITKGIVAVTNTQDGKQYTQIIIKIKWSSPPKQHQNRLKQTYDDDKNAEGRQQLGLWTR